MAGFLQYDQNRAFDDRVLIDVPSDVGGSKSEVALISDEQVLSVDTGKPFSQLHACLIKRSD